MGVNIPCVEKFDPSRLRWSMQNGTDRKRVLKYISDCLGKRAWGMHEALLLHCGGQELQDRVSKLLMNSFVAVDDVRPSVSDGLYSKYPPSPPLSVFYTKKKKKRDPKCTAPHLSSNVSTVWPNEEAHGEWNSTVQCHEAILLPRTRTVNRLSSRSQFTNHWHKIADYWMVIVKPSGFGL